MSKKKYKVVTSNLADFGDKELIEASKILIGMEKHGYPEELEDAEDLKIYFNRHSGMVFLADDNSGYCAGVTDDGKIELWLYLPESEKEGFVTDLLEEYKDLHKVDREYLDQYTKDIMPLLTEDGKWLVEGDLVFTIVEVKGKSEVLDGVYDDTMEANTKYNLRHFSSREEAEKHC